MLKSLDYKLLNIIIIKNTLLTLFPLFFLLESNEIARFVITNSVLRYFQVCRARMWNFAVENEFKTFYMRTF